jgi:hypothetical protein
MARRITDGAEGGHLQAFSDWWWEAWSGSPQIAPKARTGKAYRFRPNVGAEAIQLGSGLFTTGDLGHWWYHRFWIYIAAAPTTDKTRVISWEQGTTPFTRWLALYWRTAAGGGPGLQMWSQGGAGEVAQGAVAAVSTGAWHSVEIGIQFNAAAADRIIWRLDGTQIADVSPNISTVIWDYMQFGNPDGDTTFDVYFDDIAFNDDTGTAENTWPNRLGKIVRSSPKSDSAVGAGWTKPGGAATGLWSSVDNIPPVGVADSTLAADAEKQIRNATSTTTANYDTNCQAPAELGIDGDDAVTLMRPLANIGSNVTSSVPGRIRFATNPTDAADQTFDFGTAVGTAAGAWPTGWGTPLLTPDYAPAPNLDGNIVVRVGKNSATTNVALVSQMGAQIEYVPNVNTPSARTPKVVDSAGKVNSLAAPTPDPDWAQGDLLIMVLNAETGVAGAQPRVATPAGWTQIGTGADDTTPAGSEAFRQIFYRIWDGSTAMPTLSWTGNTAFTEITISPWFNVDQTNPIPNTSPMTVFTTGGNFTLTGFTTVSPNNVIVAINMNSWGQDFVRPTGYNQLFDNFENAFQVNPTLAAAAGAVANQTFNTSGTQGHTAILLAIQPPQNTVNKSDTESGTGTDAGTPAVTKSDSDSGTGTDAGAVPPVTLSSAETGTSTETGSLPSSTISSSDTGTGTSTEATTATFSDSDTGTGTGAQVLVQTNPPVISGEAVANIGTNTITLLGTINPGELDTSYHFEYGPTVAYGSVAPVPDAHIGPGSANVNVQQGITGLTPGTVYHFRLVASNADGSANGGDVTFSTTRPLPVPIPRGRATWKFILADTATLTNIGELAHVTNRQWSPLLDRPGSASFDISMLDDMADLITDDTALKVYRNGELKWSGYYWTANEDISGDKLSVSYIGWLKKLEKRFIRRQKIYNAQDDGDIILDLLAEANLNPAPDGYTFTPVPGAPSLTFMIPGSKLGNDGGLTGYVPVTDPSMGSAGRNMNLEQYTFIWQIMQQLSDLENGCDFEVDPLTRHLNIYRKRMIDRTGVVFGFNWGPNNIGQLGRQIDRSTIVNYELARGGATAAPGFQDDTGSQARYGPEEELASLSDVNDTNILIYYAAEEVALRATPRIIYSFTPLPFVEGGRVPEPFEDYDIGDLVHFSAKWGKRVNINNQLSRVFGMTVSITDDGIEEISQLQLAPGS